MNTYRGPRLRLMHWSKLSPYGLWFEVVQGTPADMLAGRSGRPDRRTGRGRKLVSSAGDGPAGTKKGRR